MTCPAPCRLCGGGYAGQLQGRARLHLLFVVVVVLVVVVVEMVVMVVSGGGVRKMFDLMVLVIMMSLRIKIKL